MNLSKDRRGMPLEYAAELAIEMHLLRGECCDLARQLVSQGNTDEARLEECARLDEALDLAHRVLMSAVGELIRARGRHSEA